MTNDSRGGHPRHPASEAESARSDQHILVPILVVLVVALAALIALLVLWRGDRLPQPEIGASPEVVLVIGGPGKGSAPDFVRPLAAAWAPNGDIYVSDTGNHRICVFDSKGRFIREFGAPRAEKSGATLPGDLTQPAGIAVGADGRVYVADVRAGTVLVFDERGKVVQRVVGRPEIGDHDRWTPTDVAVGNNRLYVTDSSGVAVFTLEGVQTRRFDDAGPGSPLSRPNGVALRADGLMVVSDTNSARLVALEQSGSASWTTGPASGDKRVVGLPRGVAVGRNGTVLVADAFLFGVSTFSADGVYASTWGGSGTEVGKFAYPNDVDVHEDLALITDKENNRIQVARFPVLLDAPK